MRLHSTEVASIKETEEFVIRDNTEHGRIAFTLQALPPDWDESAEEELPSPKPPRLGFEMNKKGRVMMDTDGERIEKFNEDDPTYLAALRDHYKLLAVKMILDAIVPGQIEFSAATKDDGLAEFYRSALVEMKQFGFSIGDIVALGKKVTNLSGLDDDDVKEFERVFSEAED